MTTKTREFGPLDPNRLAERLALQTGNYARAIRTTAHDLREVDSIIAEALALRAMISGGCTTYAKTEDLSRAPRRCLLELGHAGGHDFDGK